VHPRRRRREKIEAGSVGRDANISPMESPVSVVAGSNAEESCACSAEAPMVARKVTGGTNRADAREIMSILRVYLRSETLIPPSPAYGRTYQGRVERLTLEIVDDVREVLRQGTAEKPGGGRGRRVGASDPRPGKVRSAEVGLKVSHAAGQERTGRIMSAADRSRKSFPHLPSPAAFDPRKRFGTPGRAGSTEAKVPPANTSEFHGAMRPPSCAPWRGKTPHAARTRRIPDARTRRGRGFLGMPKGC
jgi:hypothetical protein